jgi:hypothetical protein
LCPEKISIKAGVVCGRGKLTRLGSVIGTSGHDGGREIYR